MISQQKNSFLDAALDLIRKAANGTPYGSQAELARAARVSEANISRWLSGSATPTLKKLEPVLMALGVRLVLPGEARPSSLATGGGHAADPFISSPRAKAHTGAEVVPAVHLFLHGANSPTPVRKSNAVWDRQRPSEQDFGLVPLMGPVGAGHGVLPLSDIENPPESWLPVPMWQMKPCMMAVRVAQGERSMLPRFRPGDIVLVDCAPVLNPTERDVYLVQEPPSEGSGFLLKRVAVTCCSREPLVIFYSENVQEGYAPFSYELALYPDGDMRHVIRGRAVGLWSSLER